MSSPKKPVEPSQSILSSAIEQAQTYTISSLEAKLISHGPYIRVYEKPDKEKKEPERPKSPALKYTSIVEVSSQKERLFSSSYPNVIKVPPTITRVVIDKQSTRSNNSEIILNRPKSVKSGPRYSRSSGSMFSNSFGDPTSVDQSQPLIPFMQMTNALQLHLKLRVLQDNERIIYWIPGSFLVQSSPFVNQQPNFNFAKLFKNMEKHDQTIPGQNYPGYLLLTNKYVYIARPLFKLGNLKAPLKDEQTMYMNPSKLIEICHKMSIFEMDRIDVGPRRQYLVFHTDTRMPGKEPVILSVLFYTRSRYLTTQVVDSITTLLDEAKENANDRPTLINQDTEWCIKNLQDTVILQPGHKETQILSYDAWPSQVNPLTLEEFDSGVKEQVTKVDFDFVKLYLFGVLLRYFKPVPETDILGAEIQHISILGTREYLYLLQERLDAWPPAIFPPEFSSRYPSKYNHVKGFLIDMVPQYTLLGVGRISDITKIERWRSWRIDSSFPQLKNLGAQLQNGHIGYYNSLTSVNKQQATTSGWFWWVRIHFLQKGKEEIKPTEPPASAPNNMFWDIVFANRESTSDFIETIQRISHRVEIVIGDD
ncbi:hypothetical protein HDV06_006714 [Boothiomyces sp. JEL0866]|nr:hypothetical protein HDV06_006714 [Boothiomyces sp. JEL0866]